MSVREELPVNVHTVPSASSIFPSERRHFTHSQAQGYICQRSLEDVGVMTMKVARLDTLGSCITFVAILCSVPAWGIHVHQEDSLHISASSFISRRQSFYTKIHCNLPFCNILTSTVHTDIISVLFVCVGRDSVIVIATRCELDGPGIESRWGRDFQYPSRPALGPTQPPVQWVPGLFRG